jgi:hypothetical protein
MTARQFVILAHDASGKLTGQIALIRTDLSSDQLLEKKSSELNVVSNNEGHAVVCLSICSADFRPKPVPNVRKKISPADVRKYVLGGHDPVLRFHQRPKGGLDSGAHLVDVIKGGRPEDKSSLGYTMLLKYPVPEKEVHIHNEAPISDQLIEAVLLIATDQGVRDVYAYSRPGGLAAYVAARKK